MSVKNKIIFAPASLLISTRILSLLAGASLIVTKEPNGGFVALFILFSIIGWMFFNKIKNFSWVKFIQPLLALFFLALAIIDYLKISQSFLLAAAHFLLSIQSARVLSMRSSRECLGSILLSSLMLLSASTLSFDWSFFILLLCFIPAIVWTLILYTISYEEENTLEEKKLFLNREQSVFIFQKWAALELATLIGIVTTILTCLFVFITFPRFNFRGFRGQFLQPVHRSGITDRINLDKSGRIYTDKTIILHVQIDPEMKPYWNGYLKGTSLSNFDGHSWDSSHIAKRQIFQSGGGEVVLPSPLTRRDLILKQKIYLESIDAPTLFAASEPFRIRIDRPFILFGEDRSISRGFSDSWRTSYEVDSQIISRQDSHHLNPSQLKLQSSIFLQRKINLIRPEIQDAEIESLAHKIIGPNKNIISIVNSFEDYLVSNLKYSLDLGSDVTPHPINNFLFKSKKGHCEYFASAMCLMLQSVGINSRPVTGFYAHEWSSKGSYYIVRSRDAHAWVEVEIGKNNWVMIDPTPRDFSSEESGESFSERWSQLVDFVNLKWNQYILSYDMNKQVAFIQKIQEKYKTFSISFNFRFSSLNFLSKKSWNFLKNRGPIWNIGIFLFVILLAFFGVYLNGILSRRKIDGIWFFVKVLNILGKRGIVKNKSETLRELARRVNNLKETEKQALSRLINFYYLVRFNPGFKMTSQLNSQIKDDLVILRSFGKS